MKLQFAFGNPRKGKKKVATKRKKPQTKKRRAKISTGAKSMAKKSHAKKRVKKNPQFFVAKSKKTGKITDRSHKTMTPSEIQAFNKKYYDLKGKKLSTKDPVKKAKLKARMTEMIVKRKKDVRKKISDKNMLKHLIADKDKELKFFSTEGKTVAKKKSRKKVSKKASKKVTKKVAKKSRKKATKKVARKAHKRVAKKAHHKKVVAATHVVKKPKSHKRRKRAKIYSHKHSTNMRHLRKGTRIKMKGSVGRGKKKVGLSAIFKVNPFKGNPMKNALKNVEKYAGMEVGEIGALALGGALVPLINSGVTKVPGLDTVAAKINELVGPQAAGSIIPMLLGLGINAMGEHLIKDAATKKYVHMAGEGLVAAGVIGLAMSMSQQYVAPAVGLAGVNYTPMHGVNYTPMHGVNYTPMAGVPQLAGPDFGGADYGAGGYQEDHRFSSADFGGMSMDASADDMVTEDDILEDGMGGLG